MVKTRKHLRYSVLPVLMVGLALPTLWPSTAHAAPLATVSDCSFTPTQGGPGTIVHAEVSQWYSSTPVQLGFAVPITPRDQEEDTIEPMETTLKPLEYPLATMQPIQAHAETTFRIPATLASGKPLPLHNLYLVCMENGRIGMGGGAGPALFTFRPSDLPIGGEPFWSAWLLLAVIGIALMISGLLMRRRVPRDSVAVFVQQNTNDDPER